MVSRRQRDAARTIAEFLGFASMELARQSAVMQFSSNIVGFMQAEGIGLEAAISKVGDTIHVIVELEPLDEHLGETPEMRKEIGEMLHEAHAAAADGVRQRVELSRQLVALADQDGA